MSEKAIKRAFNKDYSKPTINANKVGTINTKNNSPQCSFDSGTSLIGIDVNGKAPTQRSSTGNRIDNKHNYQIISVLNDNGSLREIFQSTCIDANYHKGMDNHAQRTIILQLQHGKNNGNNHYEKSPTLTSNSFEQNNIVQTYQQDRVYDIDRKMVALTAELNGRNNIDTRYKLRRLTPIECARLQTIPEWVNFNGFSDTAIYKMLGNGWTIEVIKHILSYIKD